MGFASLQHISESKVHLSQACRPAVFRLQGLVTLVAAYALRSLAGFISRRQRSWDLPFEAFTSQEVCERFRSNAPTYRFAAMIPGASAEPTWLPRFLGFNPLAEFLAVQRVFNTSTAGCSLGFSAF
jgi:hypothetical protein